VAGVIDWENFVQPLMLLFSDYDQADQLCWKFSREGTSLYFWVNCNDVFGYACADAEEIDPEDLPLLRECFTDALKADKTYGPLYAPLLFACRKRRMRPMKGAYPKPESIKPLFDASGPEST
jgi:hypothetical protein